MRRLHPVLAIAAAVVVGCQIPSEQIPAEQPVTTVAAEEPPICDVVLPNKLKWPQKLPSPQTPENLVLILQSPQNPNELWAFSTEFDHITGWLELPRTKLGALIADLDKPPPQVASATGTGTGNAAAKTSRVKVRLPDPPRVAKLARDVLHEAQIELGVPEQARRRSDLCDDDDDK